eukprot:3083475-Rhodomonas_salina.2
MRARGGGQGRLRSPGGPVQGALERACEEPLEAVRFPRRLHHLHHRQVLACRPPRSLTSRQRLTRLCITSASDEAVRLFQTTRQWQQHRMEWKPQLFHSPQQTARSPGRRTLVGGGDERGGRDVCGRGEEGCKAAA